MGTWQTARGKKGQLLSRLPWNSRVQYSLKRCKEGCKSDLQPGVIGKEWQSVSTLGRDSIRGSPWVQQLHENWQVPGQEILNATTRLERIRALGGWEAANPHCRLTQ